VDQRVCLDTDVIIDILNNQERAQRLINKIENYDIFITSINLFELLQREINLDKIELFRKKVDMLTFDELSSRKASLIFKELKKTGKLIDFRDLFIAAICIVNNCKLATFNKKHFENVKSLRIV